MQAQAAAAQAEAAQTEQTDARTQAHAEAAAQAIKTKLVGLGDDKWPILENLWDFYSKKGVKTVFVSVGSTGNAVADLDIAETLGCPAHIWSTNTANWDEVRQVLKDRKRGAEATAFTEGVDTKWVLPKNVRSYTGIPGFYTANTETFSTVSIDDCVKQCVATMTLDGEQRIDILKIALTEGMERAVLSAVLDTGYRPGLLMVKWSDMPDSNLFTTLTAGHLQNCGYTLLEKNGDRFTYMFVDRCMYEICSWETNKVVNPLVHEIISATSTQKNQF
jgi:hypothetical protein